MSQCFKGSKCPEVLGKYGLAAAGLAYLLVVNAKRNPQHAVLESYGKTMSSSFTAAAGTYQTFHELSQPSEPNHARIHGMVDSMVSRDIPARLSNGALRICQTMSGTWHSEYHRLIIASEPVARVISMFGGIIHHG
jgi:hypothetical protein